jgi:hypothetical protein
MDVLCTAVIPARTSVVKVMVQEVVRARERSTVLDEPQRYRLCDWDGSDQIYPFSKDADIRPYTGNKLVKNGWYGMVKSTWRCFSGILLRVIGPLVKLGHPFALGPSDL